jgi:hypothetical protein
VFGSIRSMRRPAATPGSASSPPRPMLIGSTTTGFDDRDAAQCSVTFTVDVPKADYQFKIGTHAGPSYSFDDGVE